jgi:hypothetical protein
MTMDRTPQSTLSELIPIGDLDIPTRQRMRSDVDVALVATALEKKVSNQPSGIVVRDTLPTTDMALTGGASATGDQWIVAAAGVAGTAQNYINALQLTATQCCGFWGVAQAVAVSNVGRLTFFLGPAQGQTKGIFQLEQLISRLESEGYFSTPLIYVAQDIITVAVKPFNAFAANTERLVLLSRMADQFGTTISAHNYGYQA